MTLELTETNLRETLKLVKVLQLVCWCRHLDKFTYKELATKKKKAQVLT